MGQTKVTSDMIKDGDVKRADLNTSTSGSAVIAKAVAGTGISLSSTGADAGTGDVTFSTPDNSTNQKVNVLKNGTSVGTRKAVNLIEGTNVTLTVADDSANDRVNVTVAAASGSSVPLELRYYSAFENLSRLYKPQTAGNATITDNGGLSFFNNTANGGLCVQMRSNSQNNSNMWAHTQTFASIAYIIASGTGDIDWAMAMGNVTASGGVGNNYGGPYAGFKMARRSGTMTCYVSHGLGSSTSSSVASWVGSRLHAFNAVFTPSTDVKYYQDGSLLATLTTNLPYNSGGNVNETAWSIAESDIGNSSSDLIESEIACMETKVIFA